MNIPQSDLIDMSCKDFDSTGDCYRTYVAKMVQYLRSAVPWGQRFKNKIPGLLPDAVGFTAAFNGFTSSEIPKLSEFKGRLRSSFQVSHEVFGLKGLQLGTRTPIPLGNNTVCSLAFVIFMNSRSLECRQVHRTGTRHVFFLCRSAIWTTQYARLFLGIKRRVHS